MALGRNITPNPEKRTTTTVIEVRPDPSECCVEHTARPVLSDRVHTHDEKICKLYKELRLEDDRYRSEHEHPRFGTREDPSETDLVRAGGVDVLKTIECGGERPAARGGYCLDLDVPSEKDHAAGDEQRTHDNGQARRSVCRSESHDARDRVESSSLDHHAEIMPST